MAVAPYQGHAEHSASKAAAGPAADNPTAAADRPGYDPSAFANQPGAASRALGYPRHDGQKG